MLAHVEHSISAVALAVLVAKADCRLMSLVPSFWEVECDFNKWQDLSTVCVTFSPLVIDPDI